MSAYLFAAGSAVWLGVLTSISPCPLATNIAAISFISKRMDSTGRVLLSGLLYTVGRAVVYVVLGILLVTAVLTIPGVSNFLQKYMNKLLGPVLVLTGMVLLDLVQLSFSTSVAGQSIQDRAEAGGTWTAGLLGIVFALSFCPISAALFFGGLIPLSIEHKSTIILPTLYGVGTGLPVLTFALLVAAGARWLGKAFDKLTQFERWARRLTGAIFVLIGIYYCLHYIFGIL